MSKFMNAISVSVRKSILKPMNVPILADEVINIEKTLGV